MLPNAQQLILSFTGSQSLQTAAKAEKAPINSKFKMTELIVQRLEKYTIKRPREVLIVKAQIDGEADEIAIFKGFSSSLMRSTAFDPDVPVLPDSATILEIDRLVGPLNPNNPEYIQQGLTWETIQPLLKEAGI